MCSGGRPYAYCHRSFSVSGCSVRLVTRSQSHSTYSGDWTTERAKAAASRFTRFTAPFGRPPRGRCTDLSFSLIGAVHSRLVYACADILSTLAAPAGGRGPGRAGPTFPTNPTL